MTPLRAFLVALGCIVFAAAPATRAEEEKEEAGKGAKEKPAKKKKKKKVETEEGEPVHDLEAWGALKEVKGTGFFTLAYTKVEGKKATKGNVFVKAADDALFYQDRMVPHTELKEGAQVWILARPVEHDVPAIQGQGTGGQDRQLQNVVAIAAGEGLQVHTEYADPRDPKLKWCEAQIAKAGASIQATYEGADYKVVLGKQTPIIMREKVESKPLKNGQMVQVSADKSQERPQTKSAADEKKEAFLAKRIVVLDPRLARTVYPVMLQ